MSSFTFLQVVSPDVHEAFQRAERYTRGDARTALFYSRRAVEVLVNWLYEFDPAFERPYDNRLSTLLTHISFTQQVPQGVREKMHLVRKVGNEAIHSRRRIQPAEAMNTQRELFHIAYWFARTYTQSNATNIPSRFDEKQVPPSDRQIARYTIQELKEGEEKLKKQDEELRQQREQNAQLQAEIAQLQARVAQRKAANQRVPDTHDYSEAETRKRLIDIYLREAGWEPTGENVAEYRVTPMPNKRGYGHADYVLWGDDGLPLGVVEAKRTSKDKEQAKQQAKLYADALEQMTGQRPIIFYTNGYEMAIWDDAQYPPRNVQGFYTKDELHLLIQRRTARRNLSGVGINNGIVDRYYQEEAIRRVTKRLEQSYRRVLLVMATGTGKTRTTVALIDLLMRAHWVKRVLFLADRKTLVTQALKAFKMHLPHANAINLLQEKEAQESRVVVSTYHTIMNQIDEARTDEGQRLFSIGHFDLLVIDEAHRSVYQKFGAIFDYFDGYLIGLTATPRDEVDHNTYSLFNLEAGVPTYSYDLDVAVADEYLVPPNLVTVPLKFMREGIRYDDLSEKEKDEWDLIEWDEAGGVPDSIDSAAINKWLIHFSFR